MGLTGGGSKKRTGPKKNLVSFSKIELLILSETLIRQESETQTPEVAPGDASASHDGGNRRQRRRREFIEKDGTFLKSRRRHELNE